MAEVVTCSQNMAPSLQGCSTQVGFFFPKVKLISSSFICFKMIWQRSSFILWPLSVLKYILLSNKPTDDVYFHVKLSLPQAKYVASSGWKTWIMIVESQHLAKIPLLTNVTQNKNNLVWSLLGKILEKWNEDKTNKKKVFAHSAKNLQLFSPLWTPVTIPHQCDHGGMAVLTKNKLRLDK